MCKISFLVLMGVIFSACCRGPYEAPVFRISYPSAVNGKDLYVKSYNEESLNFPDTISLGNLNSSNDYTQLLEINKETNAYVIFIPETTYYDSISDVNVVRKKCEKNIDRIEYKLNGTSTQGKRIVIND